MEGHRSCGELSSADCWKRSVIAVQVHQQLRRLPLYLSELRAHEADFARVSARWVIVWTVGSGGERSGADRLSWRIDSPQAISDQVTSVQPSRKEARNSRGSRSERSTAPPFGGRRQASHEPQPSTPTSLQVCNPTQGEPSDVLRVSQRTLN